MTTKKTSGHSWDSIRLEQKNFGSYSLKKDAINLRLSPKEKNDFKEVAEKLNLSGNMLLRALMRQAVEQYNQGVNPIPKFQYLTQEDLDGA